MSSIIKRYLNTLEAIQEDKEKIKNFGIKHGLTLNQMLILFMVKKHGDEFMIVDKRHIGMNPSYNLYILEKRGFIRSDKKERDRRRMLREITPKGDKVLSEFDKKYAK